MPVKICACEIHFKILNSKHTRAKNQNMDPRVRTTVIVMLGKRGYTIMEDEEDKPIVASRGVGARTKKVVVFFCESRKLSVKDLEGITKEMNTRDISHGIIVYKNAVTSKAKETIQQFEIVGKQLSKFYIELFEDKTLEYDITEHILVPKHEALTKVQSAEFKKTYGTGIPTLLTSDPVCRFYGFQKGDVVKITRRNGYITYRLVR